MEIMGVVASCSWTMPLYGISTVYMVMMTDERCQVIVIIAADDPPRSDRRSATPIGCHGERPPRAATYSADVLLQRRGPAGMSPRRHDATSSDLVLPRCCHTRQDNTVGKL
jgi:hypothetical protein